MNDVVAVTRRLIDGLLDRGDEGMLIPTLLTQQRRVLCDQLCDRFAVDFVLAIQLPRNRFAGAPVPLQDRPRFETATFEQRIGTTARDRKTAREHFRG